MGKNCVFIGREKSDATLTWTDYNQKNNHMICISCLIEKKILHTSGLVQFFYGSTYYVAKTLLIQEQGARKAKVRDS